jgi:hypothetical protein
MQSVEVSFGSIGWESVSNLSTTEEGHATGGDSFHSWSSAPRLSSEPSEVASPAQPPGGRGMGPSTQARQRRVAAQGTGSCGVCAGCVAHCSGDEGLAACAHIQPTGGSGVASGLACCTNGDPAEAAEAGAAKPVDPIRTAVASQEERHVLSGDPAGAPPLEGVSDGAQGLEQGACTCGGGQPASEPSTAGGHQRLAVADRGHVTAPGPAMATHQVDSTQHDRDVGNLSNATPVAGPAGMISVVSTLAAGLGNETQALRATGGQRKDSQPLKRPATEDLRAAVKQ